MPVASLDMSNGLYATGYCSSKMTCVNFLIRYLNVTHALKVSETKFYAAFRRRYKLDIRVRFSSACLVALLATLQIYGITIPMIS